MYVPFPGGGTAGIHRKFGRHIAYIQQSIKDMVRPDSKHVFVVFWVLYLPQFSMTSTDYYTLKR